MTKGTTTPNDVTKTYFIWCRVSGGVTGTREGYLKRNGQTAVFATCDAAETEAARLNREMNNRNAVAFFSYRVVYGVAR